MSHAPALDRITALLGDHAGLSFAAHQAGDVDAGVRRAMARHDRQTIEAYAADLEAGALSLDDLAEELTIGETYFFREHAQLEFVRRTALSPLRDREGPGAGPRIWSAGCASGEEPYSIAILLEEEGLLARSLLLATDVSQRAILHAKRATYHAWSMRGLDPARIDQYFQRTGSVFTLDARIQRAVTFERANILPGERPPAILGPHGFDLVFCRNVLIYFHPAAIKKAARRLLQSLTPGGWLITGASDPPLGEEDLAEGVMAPEGVFYRRRAPGATKSATKSAAKTANGEPRTGARSRPRAADPARRIGAAPGGGKRAVKPATVARAPTDKDPQASVLRVRALADLGHAAAAMTAIECALKRFPLSAELHYYRALLLIGFRRYEDAAEAARRVLYLEPSAAAAYLLLGSILARLGETEGALRAYRNARDISAARPKDEPARFTDGECAGQIAESAAGNERRLRAARAP